jgi:hypothetical protein
VLGFTAEARREGGMTVTELLQLTYDLHDALVRRVVIERTSTVQVTIFLDAEIRDSGEWRKFELVFHSCSMYRFAQPPKYSSAVVFEACCIVNEKTIAVSLDPRFVREKSDEYELSDVTEGNDSVVAERAEVRDLGPWVVE